MRKKHRPRVQAMTTAAWIERYLMLSLSEREELRPCYSGSGTSITCDFLANGYRLPTEAEWEYAARGGNRSKGYAYAGSNSAWEVGWYRGNTREYGPIPVGQKAPNELGLYDMSGNLWEWCWDWYGGYFVSPIDDPIGNTDGSYRVLRGGGWIFPEPGLQSVRRDYSSPAHKASYIGFRLVRTAD